jgi:uncharacterized 2Fe-2S/4Fe-4S cluster protein (DUF4445 family)
MNSTLRIEVESAKGRQVLTVAPGERTLRLSDLLRRKHLPLNTRCGQRGLCDGCLVELVGGQVIRAGTAETLEATAQPRSIRGCEYHCGAGDVVQLRIPPRSLLAHEPQIVSEFKVNVPRAHDPLWQQVEIPADEFHDLPSLAAAIQGRSKRRRPVQIDPAVDLEPSTHTSAYVTLEYREDQWWVTAIASTPGPAPLGVAIDIGTTTIALLLCDLRDGRIAAGTADFNRQMHLGDDVLTRINLCSTDPAMTRHLQKLVVRETIAPLLLEALEEAGAKPDQLRCLSIAGNTTMLHLFAGVDPSSMGVAPFTPAFLQHRVLSSADLPLPGVLQSLQFPVHLLPGAAAYVGADLTAGAFATGLVYDEGPCLLVDVGTNGEIILKHGDRLAGCATAAGPAFEGAGLTYGVRATDGAIAHIDLAREPLTVKCEKIGKAAPIGLCGTAYIDFLAAGRKVGLLNECGRMEMDSLADPAGHIIPWKDYGHALRIARGLGNTEIVISEADIASLLQAKAAIAAGILTLLERARLKPADIKKLYLAGGFGLHMNRQNAINCGLLPGFTVDQVEVVGNSSLAGAFLALLDGGALDEVARAGRRMEIIELNLDPGFESRYIDQLSLP